MNPRSIAKKLVPSELFRKIEPLGHQVEAMLWQSLARYPGRELKIIGVTGTDGKTSTSSLITQMLREAGYKVAMMTTISVDYGDGVGEQPNDSRLTTAGAKGLVASLKKVKQSGAEWLVLETTSHALAQHRVWGVPYSVAVMTNIGHEHLDYHKTFENYRDAKRQLFKLADANGGGLRTGIYNADDGSGKLFAKDIANPVGYGLKHGDIKATNVKLTPAGSRYTVKVGKDEYRIECHLPGSFNVYNSLAAVSVGRAIGLTKSQIEKGIGSLHGVEGRMTRVDEGQDFDVIVDYAHTPESFKKVYEEMRPLTKKRLITVFGSAGRRDETKRDKQGYISGQRCDVVFITEEDDRDCDGQEILDEIADGAIRAGKIKDKDLFLIHDRTQAVQAAVNMAKKGDVVLLLGKGHEKSILSNGPQAAELRHFLQDDGDDRRVLKRPYDEVSVAHEAIRNLSKQ